VWTNETINGTAPAGSRGFRKSFAPPQGKTPSTLTIAVATDNFGTLYVNGNQIINSPDWFNPQTSCVPLTSGPIFIAMNVTNLVAPPLNPGGLLVAGLVTYTDGTTSLIVTDPSWRYIAPTIPPGFQNPTFDDSRWPTAVSEGLYPVAPWGDIAISPLQVGSAVSLTSSQWIYTREVTVPGGPAPLGARAFRRTITLSSSTVSASAEILITVDNEYSLYLNGAFVGSGTDWQNAQRFVVNGIQGPKVELAIYAVNQDSGSAAGILASVKIVTQQVQGCPTAQVVISDSQWKAFSGTPPNGFQVAGFNDSSWPVAFNQGVFGVGPWGTGITVPASVSSSGSPLPGAPGGPAINT
jgi:hypothetical protein